MVVSFWGYGFKGSVLCDLRGSGGIGRALGRGGGGPIVGTGSLRRRVGTLDREIDDLDLWSLGTAVGASLLRGVLVLHLGTDGLDVEVREQAVREFEAAAKLRYLRLVGRVALEYKAVTGLLDALEIESRDHRYTLAHRIKHGTRAGLRSTQLLDGLDAAVDIGDLCFELLLLVHHDLQIGSDTLLLVELAHSFGLGHLGADNVPAYDGGEKHGDDDRQEHEP